MLGHDEQHRHCGHAALRSGLTVAAPQAASLQLLLSHSSEGANADIDSLHCSRQQLKAILPVRRRLQASPVRSGAASRAAKLHRSPRHLKRLHQPLLHPAAAAEAQAVLVQAHCTAGKRFSRPVRRASKPPPAAALCR